MRLRRKLAEQLDRFEPQGTGSQAWASPQKAGAEEPELAPLLETAVIVSRAMQRPVPPPPGKLQFGRAQVLAAVARRTRRLSFREQLTVEMRFAGKLLAALAALLVMLIPLSPNIVGAARDSMPGQLFYPLKLHIERVQFEGVQQPDIRVSLGLAFLGERVAEAQALTGMGHTLHYESVIEVHQLMSQVLQATAQTPEASMEDTLIYVAGQLKAYLDVLEALSEQAAPANAVHLGRFLQVCRSGYQVALRALEDPQGFRFAYQAGRPELFQPPGSYPLSGWAALSQPVPNMNQENGK